MTHKNAKSTGVEGFSALGQDPMLSHSITVAFSVILIIVVVGSLSTLKQDYQEFIGRTEISQVCGIVKSSVEKIYFQDGYASPNNFTKGKAYLELPEKIADLNYRMRFIGNNLSIETLGLSLNDTCKMGFNATYKGSSNGGRTLINYTRYDNGNEIISMSRE